MRKALVVLSGGMDSTIALRLAVHQYGVKNVSAISFYYKQKQSVELEYAKINCKKLDIDNHVIIDISFLGDIVKGVSANVNGGLNMPSIDDCIHDKQPNTYIPNRNAILLMMAASYAESNNISDIIVGLQSQDNYQYWDTSRNFVDNVNQVLGLNKEHVLNIKAPFLNKSKAYEIQLLKEMDGNIDLLSTTITCYNPNDINESCGVCPSCAERIGSFREAKLIDPIAYSIEIEW